MKTYADGMAQVHRFFEQCAKAGTPEPVLDELVQWLEEVLPHYLAEKHKKRGGQLLKAICINTERLLPALRRRVKQLGHDFFEGVKLATGPDLEVLA